MKKIFIWIFGFAALGTILSSWLGPKVIAWYFEPPVEIGVNCRPAVEWAMEKLQMTQTAGLIFGAILGLVLAMIFKKNKSGEAA